MASLVDCGLHPFVEANLILIFVEDVVITRFYDRGGRQLYVNVWTLLVADQSLLIIWYTYIRIEPSLGKVTLTISDGQTIPVIWIMLHRFNSHRRVKTESLLLFLYNFICAYSALDEVESSFNFLVFVVGGQSDSQAFVQHWGDLRSKAVRGDGCSYFQYKHHAQDNCKLKLWGP